MNVIDKLRYFDAYPKVLEDFDSFRIKTSGGAIGKYMCISLIIFQAKPVILSILLSSAFV